MKESATIAHSLVRCRLIGEEENIALKNYDLHIHVPSGATPKDGPSAGVTMTMAIASLLMGKPVNSKLSMTGEVTLSGKVMPVGGIKEKVIAAHRSGIECVLLPKENRKDLEDIPEEVKKDLEFVFAETIEDVFEIALDVTLPEQKAVWDLTLQKPNNNMNNNLIL